MEVFLPPSTEHILSVCLLHVRGGVSPAVESSSITTRSSPRPWRCFQIQHVESGLIKVFSTSVEVFLVDCVPSCLRYGLLHVRGGVSTASNKRRETCRLLHVRGGVSLTLRNLKKITGSSPRPWRCFLSGHYGRHNVVVFSTSVEVFLPLKRRSTERSSLLHVRGGVSGNYLMGSPLQASSPRPWRCFLNGLELPGGKAVFSTPVEVFLSHHFWSWLR